MSTPEEILAAWAEATDPAVAPITATEVRSRPPEMGVAAERPARNQPRALVVAAVLVVVAGLAALVAVRIGDGDGGDGVRTGPGSTGDPTVVAPDGTVLPQSARGVLVPATLLTTGAGSGIATYSARYDHGVFNLATAKPEYAVTWSSTTGTHVRIDGVPLRCGDPSRDRYRKGYVGTVEGAHSRLALSGADGSRVSVDTRDQPLFDTHPKELPGVAAEAVLSSVFLSPDQVETLVAHPHVDRDFDTWTHTFASGVRIAGQLRGSLDHLALLQDASLDGKHLGGVGTDLEGVRCDTPSTLTTTTEAVTYYPLLISAGARITVQGHIDRDLVADPALQGAWAVVAVPKGSSPTKVVIRQTSSGKVIHRWKLEYRKPYPD